MATAAGDHGVDPTGSASPARCTLHAARRSVRAGLGTATQAFAAALPATLTEICRELLPVRQLRAAARVVKRKMSNYGVKRPVHRNWPRPTRQPREAIHVLANPP